MEEFYKMSLAKRWFVFALFITIYLMALPAWASAEKESDAEAALGAMAEEYWTKRLVDNDYKFTYDKELEKDSMPFSEYLNKVKGGEKFKFLSVKTKQVEIDGDRGVVYLTQDFQAPFLPKGFKSTLQDLWLYRSGQWKHKFSAK